MDFNRNKMRQKKLLANFYVKVDLIPDKLSFQTTYNLGSTFQNERNVDLPYFLSSNAQTPKSAIVKKSKHFSIRFGITSLPITKPLETITLQSWRVLPSAMKHGIC